AYPDECCGFLLGKANGGHKRVQSVVPATNVRESDERYHRFLIPPDAFLRTEKMARAQAMDIVGFYHSHPNAPARPSAYDVEHGWPWYAYLIVSIAERAAGEITAWVVEE